MRQLSKKGMTWDQIMKASIAVIVFLVIFTIFNMGTSHAPSAIFNSQMKTKIAECSVASGGTDSDGDGIPDSCDPCVDIANGWPLPEGGYGSMIGADDDSISPFFKKVKVGEGFEDTDPQNPDNDGDGLHDLCEMTLAMEWALAHPILALAKTPTGDNLKEFTDPKDASDKMYCKYWYSEFQCCSRVGDVIPIGKDGNPVAGKSLKCYPHDKRPS